MSLKYVFRDDEVIVILGGVPYTVSSEDPRYWDISKAISNEDEDGLELLLSLKGRAKNMLAELAEQGIEEVGSGYTYLGNKIDMDLGGYLRASLDNGSWGSVVSFIKRLFENPSHDTRQRLFGFMQANKLPVQPDGTFLAFKVVRENYLDKHSGSVDNTPGVEVPRFSWAEVDTDPDQTCSRGYHACSKDYLSSFYSPGDRIVAVAIGPEDVGAIPRDYNDSKLRCRGYAVVADITESVVGKFDRARINLGLSPDFDDEDPFGYRKDYY